MVFDSDTVTTATAMPPWIWLIVSSVPAPFSAWMNAPSTTDEVGSPAPVSSVVPAPSAP